MRAPIGGGRWSTAAVVMGAVACLAGCSTANSTESVAPVHSSSTASSTSATTASTTTSTSTTLPPGPPMGRVAGPGNVATLTSADGRAYGYTGDGAHTTAWAGDGPIDENLREVFWPADTPFRLDHEVCMTWNDPATNGDRPYPQPGLALRIAPSGADGTGVKAVTITQNVFGSAIWLAWVGVWDTGSGVMPAGVARFDLFSIVSADAHTMQSPWRVCGRVRGDQVTFKVWIDGPEPSWSDPTHVFGTTIPREWVQPGYAGGYIGHLHSGGSATFDDIDVD